MTEPEPAHLVDDPVTARRESMIDILASWDLDGARPDATGMQIVSAYVDGKISLDEALAEVDRRVEQFRQEELKSARDE